nr:MAG TPA: CUT1-like DNA-binding domain protein [Caudoviricetes sp.]
MHCHRITGLQLAEKLGATNRYVSMILNGHRDPPEAESRFRKAVAEIIRERKDAM